MPDNQDECIGAVLKDIRYGKVGSKNLLKAPRTTASTTVIELETAEDHDHI